MDGNISTQVVIDDPGMTGHGHATVLELRWHEDDPLAVRLMLSARPDHPSLPRGEWDVLRDFLRYGTTAATGDGSVRITPCEDDRVELHLAGDARTYVVTVGVAVIRAFLAETEALVPTGDEASEEMLDALIDRLLES